MCHRRLLYSLCATVTNKWRKTVFYREMRLETQKLKQSDAYGITDSRCMGCARLVYRYPQKHSIHVDDKIVQ